MFERHLALLSILALIGTIVPVRAQIVTGAVSGTVTDKTGSAVPGAVIVLTAASTSAQRSTTSDSDGNFLFNAILPGAYTLAVERPGFKRYQRENIELTPGEKLSAGEIRLDIGEVTERVTVMEQGAAVQTASSERSGVITASEVTNLTVLNRDFSVLVSLLPGVVMNPRASSEVQGYDGTATFNVQGNRNTGSSISVDGIAAENSNATGMNNFVSLDSVQTVRILVSNFQAEFGRKPGASIMAVTKSGSSQYHGAAYYYYRHEWMNADDFFSNRSGIGKIPRRVFTPGFNVGGPVVIPGLVHRNQKLFFFVSEEWIRERRPQPIQSLTMPTVLERRGDFSQSIGANGQPITINDPDDGKKPFPGNVIPKSRINPATQTYLNLLPVPNFFNTAISRFGYNFQTQESENNPKFLDTIRVDYVLNPSTTIWFKHNYWRQDDQGWGVTVGNSPWGWLPNHFRLIDSVPVIAVTRILSPSAVLEAQAGASRFSEFGGALNQTDLQRLNRSTNGVNIPQFWPGNNPLNLVPNFTFGGITNAPNPNINQRFPDRGTETPVFINAAVTRTQGPHSFKFGIYAERWRAVKGEQGSFNGTFAFAADTNNPGDANNAYANTLLGNFQSYTESNTRPPLYENTTGLEWFAQDNWKVNRKLTLDLGVRFGWSQPWNSPRRQEAGFVPQNFNAATNVALLQPVKINNVRQAQDPFTGQLYPAALIGAIAPNHGTLYDGTVNLVTDPNYPHGLRYNSGVKTAPRIGFAYDPFGDGKTAIRGGFGIFYEIHERDNFSYAPNRNPPNQLTPQIEYGNITTFLQSQGLVFPVGSSGFNPARPLARTLNFSFGIQRDIGKGVLLDVSYVSSLGRHLLERKNYNSIPFGTTYLPSAQDPTSPGAALASQYLRPYIGYGDIQYYNYDANSSYHSLQVSANRRLMRRLTGTFAWTWSKAMDYDDVDTTNLSYLMSPKVRDYGEAGFDRTHIVKMSWIYAIPDGSHLLPDGRGLTGIKKTILDGWQVSGITTFVSGAPNGVTLTLTSGNANNLSGSPTDAALPNVIANATLPKDQRTVDRYVNIAAFAVPVPQTPGNAPKNVFRGPGINNWDTSLFKNFRVTERLRGQFRFEAYSIFNHTQFNTVNTATQFNPTTGALTSLSFGQITSAWLPRRMEVALRFNF